MLLITLMVLGADTSTSPTVPRRVPEMPPAVFHPRPPRPNRTRFAQRRLAPPTGEGTPIVLSFTNAPVAMTTTSGEFSFEPGGRARSAWPTAVTPWLVRDLDHDGRITSGRELFGSFTQVGERLAAHGFEALAALDTNGDGVLDARDPAFGQLLLWRDRNADRRSQPDELSPLAESGVTSLSLRFHDQPRCDARGTCERERALFHFTDAAGVERIGAAIDLHFELLPAGRVSANDAPAGDRG
jgi:hypothetical protein